MSQASYLKTSILSLLLLSIAGQGFAQFKMSAEVRPRAEYRHGFKKPIDPATQDAAFFVEQRSRIYLDYQNSDFSFGLSLQDIRIWGSEGQIYKPAVGVSPNFAAVNQAWGAYKLTKGAINTAIKAGRQELNYDNARFLGNLAWAQQSRSHDAVLLMFSDSAKTHQLHLGGAFNQDANTPEFRKLLGTFYDRGGNYKTMQFAWYHGKFGKTGVSLLALNNGVQAGTADSAVTHYSQTLGTFITTALGTVKITAEGYLQTGSDPAGNDLSAFLASVSASVPLVKGVGLTLGGDYVSGTELDAEAGTNNAFNPLYGTNHKFYGLMDYFYVGNPSAQMGRTVGLIDPYLKVVLNSKKLGKLVIAGHQFLSPVTIYGDQEARANELGASLGTEIDIVYARKLAKGVSLAGGYSQLFATESMAAIKGGDINASQNWAWLMITFKPTLFTSNGQ